MVEMLETKEAEAMTVALGARLESPSIGSMAESICVEAVEYCAQKLGLNSLATAIDLLGQQDRVACEYCLYSIAKRAAASLGAMDENVKVVYLLDYDATPEDRCFVAEVLDAYRVHLLVWTRRKTAAFDALVEALDRALVQAFSDTVGLHGPATCLDVQVVDDVEVEQHHGYGAFHAWMHQQPIQIWER